jgi:hypothetical protein
LYFAKERIGPLAAIITTVFYLLALYLFALPNTPENPFASIYSETLIKTTCQHLLLLVGFDTLIYRKYYDTPPILVGHQRSCRTLSGNLPIDLGFSILRLYIGEEAVSEGGPPGLMMWWRGQGLGRATIW